MATVYLADAAGFVIIVSGLFALGLPLVLL